MQFKQATMRIFTLLIMIILYSFHGSAQPEKKCSLTIMAGPSFPLGGLSQKNFSIADQATTGAFLDLSCHFTFLKNFGGVALLRGKVHGVDFSSSQPVQATTKTTGWKSAALMVGLFREFSLNKGNSLIFELTGLAGLQRTISPSMSVPNMEVFSPNEEAIAATAFAYMFGAAFKYNLNQSIALKLSGDFNESRPKYPAITIYDSTGQIIERRLYLKQSTASLGLGIGLVIRIK